MAAQERILGQPCPVLACAVENRVEYCPRDCNRFPCTLFRAGPYPFSHGYLDMQERRRSEKQTGRTPSGNAVEVPTEYWDDLERRDIEEICENALAAEHPAGLILPFLTEHLLLDRQNRCLYRQEQEKWNPVENPLLELLCLVYVLDAGSEPLSHEMVSVKELKTAHFFQGPHELKVRPLLERYGNDLDGFRGAAERLGGEPLDLADAAYRLLAFPKVPLYYLFWKG
ncbi:MAG: DUF3786 domain-containing protein, partial [Pseudomonadota bacterium]